MDAIPAHLNAAYARRLAIHRTYDTAFSIGRETLPAEKRPHVSALYAHARMLDQIVGGHSLPGAVSIGAVSMRQC